ncbi:MAG: pyridoxamine 5'-phosphate oxidase family protein [Acidobacteria bacterium]|nr:pyridoxamine 5'-phosphate oxidase family protein [Acidobacteriota bacterium]
MAQIERPRRRDRARDEAWIRECLARAPFGVVACVRDGRPYQNPLLFVFDGERDAIYLHTGRHGRTREAFEGGVLVSFCVAEMGRILPAGAAIDFSVEYASVVVSGDGSVVDDPAEATRALALLMDKYAPQFRAGADYRPTSAADLERTSVLRIRISSWGGKENRKPEFPGAYPYRGGPS